MHTILRLEKILEQQLFQRNLLKVVFSTETLAAGINMPARTTVPYTTITTTMFTTTLFSIHIIREEP